MRRWGNCKEGSEELVCVIGEEFYAGMVGSHCMNQSRFCIVLRTSSGDNE